MIIIITNFKGQTDHSNLISYYIFVPIATTEALQFGNDAKLVFFKLVRNLDSDFPQDSHFLCNESALQFSEVTQPTYYCRYNTGLGMRNL